MKAIRVNAFGGPDQLVLFDVPDPVPGPGEVVIDVEAAGVNPADTYMLTGNYVFRPDLPYTPGGDCAGVVSATGPGVYGLNPGDRVFVSAGLSKIMSGAYAERALHRMEDVLPIPDGIGFAEAVCFGVPYVTAHLALFARGRAARGETVFIHGASGAVGTAAIQLAREAGLTVIGSAGSAAGLALVEAEGAQLAVDHGSPGYLDRVRDATEGRGPDLIVEMLADVNLAADMDLVAHSGRIVIVGCRGEISINPRVAMLKEIDIRGTAVWNASRDSVAVALSEILAGAANGKIRPVVGQRFGLKQAADAHRAVLQPGAKGKVVLCPKG
ncbi:NADPH:quinone reductase [Ruegeria sediminis]|uniref:NADPH:quinone reductase n=1 Tax=Ruegeria sediminis TaxID=2583820 RepID=A0ABY2WTS7_9RHOB|nr:NADPH:quinone reductase [Ruegeria sediminis]TMV04234.1 NADPH:quinone reductase [Ruegeria sediminis]